MLLLLLHWMGWAGLLWGMYSMGDSIRRDYYERAQLQMDNLWLYKHCMENTQLKAHTDACDRVALLFAESPLEGAVLHPVMGWLRQLWDGVCEWHASATGYVNTHRYMFMGLWLVLFLALPRLCVFAFARTTAHLMDLRQERREARLRAAAIISTDEPPSALFAGRHRRRCIV
jgi:hypothetical protein